MEFTKQINGLSRIIDHIPGVKGVVFVLADEAPVEVIKQIESEIYLDGPAPTIPIPGQMLCFACDGYEFSFVRQSDIALNLKG